MSQSKGVITSCQQLVYITQWFTEMSEMQSQDFMKYLLKKYAKSGQQMGNQLVNGFTTLGISDRPASIFQCRMKLFNEWFLQWSDEEKQELLIRLRNIDSKFMDEFQSNIDSNSTTGAVTDDYQSTGHTMNGNIDDDSKSSEQIVIDAINSDQNEEPIDVKAVPEDNQTVIIEETEEQVEQPIELVVEVEAQEVDEVVVSEVEVEECLKKDTDEPNEPVVNNINKNESSSELQEVCG